MKLNHKFGLELSGAKVGGVGGVNTISCLILIVFGEKFFNSSMETKLFRTL